MKVDGPQVGRQDRDGNSGVKGLQVAGRARDCTRRTRGPSFAMPPASWASAAAAARARLPGGFSSPIRGAPCSRSCCACAVLAKLRCAGNFGWGGNAVALILPSSLLLPFITYILVFPSLSPSLFPPLLPSFSRTTPHFSTPPHRIVVVFTAAVLVQCARVSSFGQSWFYF